MKLGPGSLLRVPQASLESPGPRGSDPQVPLKESGWDATQAIAGLKSASALKRVKLGCDKTMNNFAPSELNKV